MIKELLVFFLSLDSTRTVLIAPGIALAFAAAFMTLLRGSKRES